MFYIVLLGVLFLLFLFLGIPVGASLGISVTVYLLLNITTMPVSFVAHNMVSSLISYVLLAMPCFILAGRIMNESGVTDRIFKLAIGIVGRIKGGLAYANCLASMMFASMSGTVVGDCGGLGAVEIEMMNKAGYKIDFSAGITAASSALGPIIPPSVIMVTIGSLTGMSVGKLFIAGIIPGIILTALLMLVVFFRSIFTKDGRAWPVERIPFSEVARLIPGAIPAFIMPLIILGGIILGVVTPTEAAVLAIDYAIVLGLIYRKISFKSLWKAFSEAVETNGLFLFIMSIASVFTWILTREGLSQILTTGLLKLNSSSPVAALFVVVLIVLIVGCFLDTGAATILLVPMLFQPVMNLGIDPIVFGMIFVIAIITGVITPPFGMALFVTADVAKISYKRVAKEAIIYLPSLILVIVLIILYPKVVTWLPNILIK